LHKIARRIDWRYTGSKNPLYYVVYPDNTSGVIAVPADRLPADVLRSKGINPLECIFELLR
jgi:hypothetical protein